MSGDHHDERRVRQLRASAQMRAKVFGAQHPTTRATLARLAAAQGEQLPRSASALEFRAWHREAGDHGYGNRTDRTRHTS